MKPIFEELDYQITELGELVLRRRSVLAKPGAVVYEVRLGGDFLMSSMVRGSELALADLGLTAWGAAPARVLMGGLGLGYSAHAALAHGCVEALEVVEFLEPVLAWHRRGLVPLGPALCGDSRVRLTQGDFFERVLSVDPPGGDERWHVILVDIDHSPRHLLSAGHGRVYSESGLLRIAARLEPGGVFALWSCEGPDEEFLARLAPAFRDAEAHPIEFYNPMIDEDEVNTIYVARRG